MIQKFSPCIHVCLYWMLILILIWKSFRCVITHHVTVTACAHPRERVCVVRSTYVALQASSRTHLTCPIIVSGAKCPIDPRQRGQLAIAAQFHFEYPPSPAWLCSLLPSPTFNHALYAQRHRDKCNVMLFYVYLWIRICVCTYNPSKLGLLDAVFLFQF